MKRKLESKEEDKCNKKQRTDNNSNISSIDDKEENTEAKEIKVDCDSKQEDKYELEIPVELQQHDCVHPSKFMSPGYKRCICTGGSGSGKTYGMLLRYVQHLAPPTVCHLWLKNLKRDKRSRPVLTPIYQYWVEDMKSKGCEVYAHDDLDDLQWVVFDNIQFREIPNNLLIFDDYCTHKDLNNENLIKIFSFGRQDSCNIVLIAHDFYNIPKPIRTNATDFALFSSPRAMDIFYAGGIKTYFRDPADFKQKYFAATKKTEDEKRHWLHICVDPNTADHLRVRRDVTGIALEFLDVSKI